jgi:hypothetical protein
VAEQINSCRSDHQALACGLDHIGSHYLQPVEHEDSLDLRQPADAEAGMPGDNYDERCASTEAFASPAGLTGLVSSDDRRGL